MGSTGAVTGSGKKQSALNFENMSKSDQLAKIKAMQQAMGQTGDEAGDPNDFPQDKLYVNTSKAMNINAYLLSGGKSYMPDSSQWNWWITKSWIQNTIKTIDAGMRPLSEAVQVSRYINADALGKMTGVPLDSQTFKALVNTLPNSSTGKAFSDMLKNLDYVHKAYTSASYVADHSTYDSRDVKLEITYSKGTPAIVTNNHAEHEIVGGRNLKYNFTGNWRVDTTSKGNKQLVLEIII